MVRLTSGIGNRSVDLEIKDVRSALFHFDDYLTSGIVRCGNPFGVNKEITSHSGHSGEGPLEQAIQETIVHRAKHGP